MEGKNNQIILLSESSQDFSSVCIHEKDHSNYLVCSRVVGVIKKPDELSLMRDAAAQDVLNALGPISKEEADYYSNL
jgi:hypothetical protein